LLFDTTPPEESKDMSAFAKRLFQIVKEKAPLSRKSLKLIAIMEFFCCYNNSDYSKTVTELLKGFEEMRLYSLSGKTRINDNELLSTKPFNQQ
jgi:hypothetical protein